MMKYRKMNTFTNTLRSRVSRPRLLRLKVLVSGGIINIMIKIRKNKQKLRKMKRKKILTKVRKRN